MLYLETVRQQLLWVECFEKSFSVLVEKLGEGLASMNYVLQIGDHLFIFHLETRWSTLGCLFKGVIPSKHPIIVYEAEKSKEVPPSSRSTKSSIQIFR